ncbi:hypothetical protein C9374_011270 [Naegleria lovaniensis]|uniref:EGF domain-specific O-linked N-acetylglucosamine transferase n=1 Tax=Naegleria lovaniensis TaxID=51637 RepID=A0AA88KWG9_NAELO|nr:uncharacterized protein C9374_011270 [Naegleria lovaniensis]KAG2392545.1 hypothetical protein C9374_011270 [Naegleria lovaniensis]
MKNSRSATTASSILTCSRFGLILLVLVVVIFNVFMFRYIFNMTLKKRKSSDSSFSLVIQQQQQQPKSGTGEQIPFPPPVVMLQHKEKEQLLNMAQQQENPLVVKRGFDDESSSHDDDHLTTNSHHEDPMTFDGTPNVVKRVVIEEESSTQYYSFVLNEQVPNYGVGFSQPQECDSSFGLSFYKGWRNGEQVYCKPKKGNSKFTNSEVNCYRYRQPKHSGMDIFCEMKNVMFDFSKLKTMTSDCQQVWNMDGCKRYYEFNEGAMLGMCKKESFFNTDHKWPTGHFQQVNRPIFNGFSEAKSSLKKFDEIVENPVLMVARDGAFNTYHSMEDFVNAFLVLETLKLNPSRDQLDLLIIDQEVDGPYAPMWSRAFSNDKTKLRMVKDWVSQGKKILFKRAIVNLPGVSSPIVKDIGTRNPCGPMVDLFVNFGRHILKSFDFIVPPRTEEQVMQLPALSDNVKPTDTTLTVNVTIIDRKYHHERKDVSRGIYNMKEIVNSIQELSGMKISGITFKVNVVAVDFAQLTFEKQLEMSYNTQILIGVHGAGLTHLLFQAGGANILEGPKTKEQSPLVFRLRPQWVCGGGSVIEIPPLFGQHYNNMARWAGRKYMVTQSSSPNVNAQQVTDYVKQGLQDCAQFFKSFYSSK